MWFSHLCSLYPSFPFFFPNAASVLEADYCGMATSGSGSGGKSSSSPFCWASNKMTSGLDYQGKNWGGLRVLCRFLFHRCSLVSYCFIRILSFFVLSLLLFLISLIEYEFLFVSSLLFIVVFVSYCFLIVFGAFVSYFLLVNRWNSFIHKSIYKSLFLSLICITL